MRDLSFDTGYSSRLLELRVRELVFDDDAVSVVVVADGEVDITTAPAMAASLAEAGRRAAAARTGCVVADLASVSFMGSVGVRALRSVQANTRALRIAAPSQPVQRVMELADATEFAVYPSIDAAVLPARA